VTKASHDEFLAMRLIRDRVPGCGDRYIRYLMEQLVEALEKYSPLRQIARLKGNTLGSDDVKISTAVKLSPVLEAGESRDNVAVETIKVPGGDGGESNSPSRRSCPGPATSLVSSFILPVLPQLTELRRASRYIFHRLYRRGGNGTPAFRHPFPTRRGGVGTDGNLFS